MNREVFLCNQSSRQGSAQMLFVVPRRIHHAAISLSPTGCSARYSCSLTCTCSCSLSPILNDQGDLQWGCRMKTKSGWISVYLHPFIPNRVFLHRLLHKASLVPTSRVCDQKLRQHWKTKKSPFLCLGVRSDKTAA